MYRGSSSEAFGDAIGIDDIRQQAIQRFKRLEQDGDTYPNDWKYFEAVEAGMSYYHGIATYMATAAIRRGHASNGDCLEVAGAIIGVAAEMQTYDTDRDAGRYAACGKIAMSVAIAEGAVVRHDAAYDAMETGIGFVVNYEER